MVCVIDFVDLVRLPGKGEEVPGPCFEGLKSSREVALEGRFVKLKPENVVAGGL